MIGVLSWIAAGALVALLARLVSRRRRRWWIEGLAAVGAAAIAGFLATTLDFGGLATLDWRSASFAFAVAAAAVAIVRLRK